MPNLSSPNASGDRRGFGARDMLPALEAELRRHRPETAADALALLRRYYPAAPLVARAMACDRFFHT